MQCQTYGVLLLANLKKAVTISMTEQSRQQIINKRLQLSLQSQQKLLIASTQETQKVVQYQVAKLTQQDIHLRVIVFICLEVRITFGIGNVYFNNFFSFSYNMDKSNILLGTCNRIFIELKVQNNQRNKLFERARPLRLVASLSAQAQVKNWSKNVV